MRYRVTTPTTTPRAVKRDFASSLESLTKSLDDLYLAYDAVVAAEGRVIEAEECLNDCHEALESIKRFGVNEINMAILNKDNNLNDALGMENLALEAISKLADADKKLLQSKYVSSLEALESDSKKGFFAKIKDFIAKAWNWIKEWFMSDAKLVAILKECKFEGEPDPDKEITALKYEDAVKTKEELAPYTVILEDGTEQENYSNFETKGLDTQRGTAKELGWDATKAKDLRGEMLNTVRSRADFKRVFDKDVEELKQTIRSSDEKLIEKGKQRFKLCMLRIKALQNYKRLFNRLAMSLIAVNKVCKPNAGE